MHKMPVFQPYLEEEKYGGKAGFFMSENEDKLEKYGQPEGLKQASHIRILTIIGEVEGHENLGNNSKTTKYEHVIPLLAAAKKITMYMDFLCLSIPWAGMWRADLPLRK